MLSQAGKRWRRPRAGRQLEGDGRRVIVVGSGITALVAAALLAKSGYELLVLEMHQSVVGGHARTVEIDGLMFCLGPQYVWNFEQGTVGYEVLGFLGLEDEIHFLPMRSDGFEHVVVGSDTPFDVPMGLNEFREAALSRFSAESAGLRMFFDYLRDLFAVARVLHDRGLYLTPGWPMRLGLLSTPLLNPRQKFIASRMYRWTLKQLFDHCGFSPRLRRVLFGHAGVFAENESTLSLGVYAAATGYYHAGATYPERGFHALIGALVSVIEANGGRVLCSKRVTRLRVVHDRVASVLCSDDTGYEGDLIISNLSPRRTLGLIQPSPNGIARYQPSNSLLTCCIGLRGYQDLENLFLGRNFWWQDGDCEVEFARPDMSRPPRHLFVSSPSAVGMGGGGSGRADQSLIVFAPASYDQAKRAWDRGESDHDELRTIVSHQVIQAVDQRLLPGLASHVTFARAFTPMDIEHEVGAERGNVYGRSLAAKHVDLGLGASGLPENVHLAGATIGLPGVATAFQTARILVERITGRRL